MARRAWGCARCTGRNRSVLQPQEAIPAGGARGDADAIRSGWCGINDCAAAAIKVGLAR